MRASDRFVVLAMALSASVAWAAEPTPFFEARTHQGEYVGPGREAPPPTDVLEVAIGYFGPSDPADPRSGDMWRAAQQAVEEANAEGGWNGKPFRLVAAWSRNPWDAAVKELTGLVFKRRVWAIVGGADSASTHLAEQVVAKARVPLVSPVSTDKTANLANVPWAFSVAPGDHLLAPLLADAIAQQLGAGQLVRISADDHDSRMFAREMDQALRTLHLAVRFQFECAADLIHPAPVVEQVLDCRPSAVLVSAGPMTSARLIAALRQAGYREPIFGSSALGHRQFQLACGDAAEGVVFPLLYEPQKETDTFVSSFHKQTGHLPDYTAAHTYDAVRLVVAAVRKEGLNRARIHDAIRSLSPWRGATGPVVWDGLGSNTRPARLGTIRQGCPRSLSAELTSAAVSSDPTAECDR